MKYVLPLLLVTSAALALAPQTPFELAGLWPEPAPPPVPVHVDPPWLSDAWEGTAGVGEGDPHAGLSALDDPHAGLHAGADPVAMTCPRDTDGPTAGDEPRPSVGADPHAGLHEHDSAGPAHGQVVTRSTAPNGRTVAEIFAERTLLSEHPVTVRGTVVKRTDGILGKTYLHVRDGSGSPEREDHDLTVTTNDEFQVGEVVEVEGHLLIDQDLGLGYRYTALLEAAHRVGSK